jgi:hypothetical protein
VFRRKPGIRLALRREGLREVLDEAPLLGLEGLGSNLAGASGAGELLGVAAGDALEVRRGGLRGGLGTPQQRPERGVVAAADRPGDAREQRVLRDELPGGPAGLRGDDGDGGGGWFRAEAARAGLGARRAEERGEGLGGSGCFFFWREDLERGRYVFGGEVEKLSGRSFFPSFLLSPIRN